MADQKVSKTSPSGSPSTINAMALSRSEIMRRIRGKNTIPEIAVRRILRVLGFSGYRLHRKDLPGSPDIAFVGRRKAIFVNGCFWHGHSCKVGMRKPKSNQEYWIPKIERNILKDTLDFKGLEDVGWKVLVVWECEIIDPTQSDALKKKLKLFLNN